MGDGGVHWQTIRVLKNGANLLVVLPMETWSRLETHCHIMEVTLWVLKACVRRFGDRWRWDGGETLKTKHYSSTNGNKHYHHLFFNKGRFAPRSPCKTRKEHLTFNPSFWMGTHMEMSPNSRQHVLYIGRIPISTSKLKFGPIPPSICTYPLQVNAEITINLGVY